MKKTNIVSTAGILILLTSTLYSEVDETFVKMNSTVNKSFIKTMAKNRARVDSSDASYTAIDGKEELKDALDSGVLDSKLEEGNGIKKQYIYTEIKNVKLNDRDLKDIKGDTLNLGSQIEGEGQNVVQVLNIKNTKIKTDKHINAGIETDASNIDGITNVTSIENSSLIGGD
ncbi:hypothetical protein MNB_SV-13-898 [hydrothermal vent metagenome]|uniref:Uncharacterized protein n=1 Tax=hydrothermal vent metagenome TaxID=652676 RepID=A0A1W1D0Y4_9ZZZZ